MIEDTDIKSWLDGFVLHDEENEEDIMLNNLQKHDINLVLQKRYALLQWEQGFSQPDTNTSFPTLASLISWFFVILFKCTVVFQLLLCTILNWPL